MTLQTPSFFEQPIINSPYQLPTQHWEFDENGQPTGNLLNYRRKPKFISAIPKAKRDNKKKNTGVQQVYSMIVVKITCINFE